MAPKHFVLVAKFLGKFGCWCIVNFAFDGALRQLHTHATFDLLCYELYTFKSNNFLLTTANVDKITEKMIFIYVFHCLTFHCE